MFDKYRSYTQSSAFKRQQKPFSHHAYLFQATPPTLRSLLTRAGSLRTHHRSARPKRLVDLSEVL